MLSNIKFVQKVLINKNGTFLLIKRSSSDDTNPGKWDLPGGNVEEGEDIEEALKREVLEETGIILGAISPKKIISFTQNGVYVILAIYEADYISGEVTLSTEHEDSQWVSIQDMGKIDVQDWLRKVLNVL